MKFTRRLFRCCSAGVIVWFIACVGTGFYLRPFIVLCGWSVVLLHRLLPVSFPADVAELAWPKLCVISLISWVTVAVSVAAVSHWVWLLRRREDIPKI
jgi:hypothetical protein